MSEKIKKKIYLAYDFMSSYKEYILEYILFAHYNWCAHALSSDNALWQIVLLLFYKTRWCEIRWNKYYVFTTQ